MEETKKKNDQLSLLGELRSIYFSIKSALENANIDVALISHNDNWVQLLSGE